MKDKTYERDINLYQEEKIYCVDGSEPGQKNYEKIRYAIGENNAVGSVSGYYDEELSILHMSSFFLENLGYECRMLTKDGTPAYTKVFKSDSKDQDGKYITYIKRSYRRHDKPDKIPCKIPPADERRGISVV